MRRWLLFFSLFVYKSVSAQQDPEFPKGAVLYLSAQQGKSTSFDSSPDLYVGGISVCPQLTVIPKHLRLGVVSELVYTDKRTSFLFGPRLALKIKTIDLKNMGSILNLQWQTEHLWGTRKQRSIGTGFSAEAFQLITFSFTAHRDYVLNYWWFRAGIGFNLLHKKKSLTGEDPMDDN